MLEAAAVAFSLLAVALTVRKSVWCWPVGLVGVVAYGVLFWRIRLYADMALQVVFFVQGLYGWWFWGRGGGGSDAPGVGGGAPPVRRLGARPLALLVALVPAGALVVGTLLARTTDASLPRLDALLALTSLTANALLARKVLESWWLWIGADVLYVGMFVQKGVYLSAGLYVVFLALATAGLLRWLREEREATGGGRRTATAALESSA